MGGGRQFRKGGDGKPQNAVTSDNRACVFGRQIPLAHVKTVGIYSKADVCIVVHNQGDVIRSKHCFQRPAALNELPLFPARGP